jgi:hypothetical protein
MAQPETQDQLTADETAQLQDAYERAYSVDAGESERPGEHVILIALLNRLGYKVLSVDEAYKVTERILYG